MQLIDVVIETPKGSNLKYAYEPATGFFQLKKMLPAGMMFPFDFGFIPGTKGEDGDPLDVMILAEFTSFPGCKMGCRLVGSLKVEQHEEGEKEPTRNDRFIAIPVASLMFSNINSLDEMPAAVMEELEIFFKQYTKREGKILKVEGRANAAEAMQTIAAASA